MTIETLQAEVAQFNNQAAALLGTINAQKDVLIQRVAAATAQADRAQGQADQVNTGVGAAAGAAAQALAIYGTTAAMQAKLDEAKALASAAQTAAASAASVLSQDLSAISAALHRSPNAITAMCIYDLSKDTDGGSWCDRMEHSSWMTEPLNGAWRGAVASEAACRAISGAATGDYFQSIVDGKFYKLNAGAGVTEVFRGNRAKCPRLPLPIAEAGSLSVFDGTQPGRPMWGRWAFAPATFGTITGLAAINGKVLVATTLGLITLDLARDEGRFQQAAADRTFRLTDRASGSQTLLVRPAQAFIVNNAVNAVTACVLPDAPIDIATGLQIPTIGVATVGGVSLIRHTGAVESTPTTGSAVAQIFFDKGWIFASCQGGGAMLTGWPLNEALPSASTTHLNVTWKPSRARHSTLGMPRTLDAVKSRYTNNGVAGPLGVQFFKENYADPSKALTSHITGSYSTGYMVGDIRRAYLCNTEVESVSAPELVVNGTFDVDTAGWTFAGDCVLTSEASRLKIVCGTAAGTSSAMQTVSGLVIGRSYKFSVDAIAGTGTSRFYVGKTASTAEYVAPVVGGILAFGATFVASTTTAYIALQTGVSVVSGQTAYFDNISVKEVFIHDRSYKAASATVYGTLVKTPVA
jgi:hypothetical protein